MNEITKIEEADAVAASTTHKNVWCALAAAQLEMGKVGKGAVNPAFKTRYADLADVASVVIPAVARHGIATLQYLVGNELDVMRTEFVHGESETRVNCDVRLIVGKNDMQGMKSATTYAKRIGLESLSGVAPDDDDGNAAVQSAPPRQQPQARRDDQPRFDPKAAADRVIAKLSKAETEAALSEAWEAEAECRREIHAANADEYERVKKAAADRKAALPKPILDDEIPY